jgi:hypothetical protein
MPDWNPIGPAPQQDAVGILVSKNYPARLPL